VFPVGVVVVLIGLFLRRQRIGRGPVVAACIFCGTLTPALGFFSVYPMRYSFVADHFQYHASIALIALLTAALVGVFPRPGESVHLERKAHKLGLSVAVLVLAILGARTAWQCRIYKNLETLYGSILASEPDSWFAHNNLAAVYVLQDKIDDALRHLRRAKEINPHIAANPGDETGPQIPPAAFAYYQVGSILAKSIGWSTEVLPDVEKQRRLRAAIAHFEKALEIKTDYRSAWANMAAAKANRGDLAAAERDFQQALELDPQDTMCLMGMVNLHLTVELRLLQQGRTELALSHYESAKSFVQRALRAEPDNRRVRGELVKMHVRMGDILFARGLRRHADLHLVGAYKVYVEMAPAEARIQWILEDTVEAFNTMEKEDCLAAFADDYTDTSQSGGFDDRTINKRLLDSALSHMFQTCIDGDTGTLLYRAKPVMPTLNIVVEPESKMKAKAQLRIELYVKEGHKWTLVWSIDLTVNLRNNSKGWVITRSSMRTLRGIRPWNWEE
jgi:tetratricopeptide (TPR) repeat protein